MTGPKILDSADGVVVEDTCKAFGLSRQEFEELHHRAVAAKGTAYCPYSRFRVGATLLSEEGIFISGANVENASYPVGTCAERVAVGTAVVQGFKKFKAISVATDVEPPCSPCGMCRQFIREFCDFEVPILMFDVKGNYTVAKLRELLPLSFGPEALPPPEKLLAARQASNGA